MNTEQNKQTVRRIYDELINQEKKSVIDEVYAPDLIMHDPFMGTTTSVDAFRQLLAMFDAAFPGHRAQVHHILAEGDWVSVMHSHTGTHAGPFMNMPPTGKGFDVRGVEVYRMADGKVAEFWRHDDDAGLLMQLGILPAPQAA